MTATSATKPRASDLNNQLFTAILSAILIVFLVASALVLLSNVWYLARGTTEGRGSGWALLLQSLQDPENHFSIKLSMMSALVTTVISMFFAIPAAYILARHRVPGHNLIDTLLDLPIVVPPPVMGISLLILFQTGLGPILNHLTPPWAVTGFNRLFSAVLGQPIEDPQDWVYTTRGIILAQFFIACSFGIRAVKATFDTIGFRHEEVARTLGCTKRQAFFHVVLPMARSGIVAGAIMTWARAMAEFGPILFFCGATRGKTDVMPVAMFLSFSVGRIEQSVALVLIMLTISVVTLLTFKKLGGRGYLW
jgi:molybdate transport system permease protein